LKSTQICDRTEDDEVWRVLVDQVPYVCTTYRCSDGGYNYKKLSLL
jgi:hypothetical protein